MIKQDNKYNYRIWLFQLGLFGLLTGCGQEDGLPGSPEATVSLQPDFHVGSTRTRSIVNGHSAGGTEGTINSVAVFVTKSADGHSAYPGVTASGKTSGLSRYSFDGTNWIVASGYPEVKLSNLEARVYAFSPSDAALTPSANSTAHTIPAAIPAAQTFDGTNVWDCSVADYMYGSGTKTVGSTDVIKANNVNPETPSATVSYQPSIYMQHALSQIVFTLQSANGRAVTPFDYVLKVEVKREDNTSVFSTSGSGTTMSIADGAITSASNVAALTFTPTSTAKAAQCGAYSSPKVVAYGLVAPRNVSGSGNLSLTFTLNKNVASPEDRTQRKLTVTVADQTWEKGRKYIYKLTLSDRAISVAAPEIGSWSASAGGSADMLPDGFN